MYKKLLSLLLAVAMILTMLPAELQASGTGTTSGSTRFGFRWAPYDTTIEKHNVDRTQPLESSINAEIKNGSPVSFYYTDSNGVETNVSVDELSFSNPSILNIKEDMDVPGIYHITWIDFGSTDVWYTDDQSAGTIKFSVELSPADFSNATTLTTSSYVGDFTVSDTSNSIYFAAQSGWTIKSLSLSDDLAQIASFALSTDQTYATISFTGAPHNNGKYYIRYDAEKTSNGVIVDTCTQRSRWINLTNGYPRLAFRWGEWNSNNLVENPSDYLQDKWITDPTCNSHVFFYFLNNGTETKLTASELSSSDSNIVTIQAAEENPAALCMTAVDFGAATIDYSYGGKTYSVNISVDLPDIGFYSSTTPSTATWLREFTITDTEDTFYLVPNTGYTLLNVAPMQNLADIATVSFDPSNDTYATIQITGVPESNRDYSIKVTKGYGQNETSEYYCSLGLVYNKPHLAYRFGSYENNTLVEDTSRDRFTKWNTEPGNDANVFFYFVENGTETPLKANELNSTNSSTVFLSESSINADAVRMNVAGLGSTSITYEKDGKTYSMDVTVDIPSIGFYSAATASQSTWIPKFLYSDTNDTLYLVSNGEWTLTDVELLGDFKNVASVSVDSSNSYATIKFTGSPDIDRSYDIKYSASHNYSDNTRTDFYQSIHVINTNSTLAFRYADINDGIPYENVDAPLMTTLESFPNNMHYVYFYTVENGVVTGKLPASALTSSDEHVVTFSEFAQDNDAVCVSTHGFGKTTISGATYHMPVNVTLPLFGFYSSSTASESTYIQEFKVTEDDRTFYLIPQAGWALTDVELLNNLANIASVELDTTNGIAKITVQEAPVNQWEMVRFSAENVSEGRALSGERMGLNLLNGLFDLRVREPLFVNDIPTEDTSIYPQDSFGLRVKSVEPAYFYLINDDTEIKLSAADLKTSDPNILTITSYPGSDAIVLEAHNTGTAQISYSDGKGNTYTMDVTILLPIVGCYSGTTATVTTLLDELTVSEHKNSFYVIHRNGWSIQKAELLDGLSDIATVHIAEDGSYATVTVTGTPEDCGYRIRLTCQKNTKISGSLVLVANITLINGRKPADEDTPITVDEKSKETADNTVSEIVEAIENGTVSSCPEAKGVSSEVLKEMEKELQAGNTIATEIVANTLTEKEAAAQAPKDVEKILSSAKKSENVLQYLDLSVLIKSVAPNGTEKVLGSISKVNEEIVFTMELPENVKTNGKKFYVLRIHDGKADKLPVTMNGDGTISFKTDKYSTYALLEDILNPFTDVKEADYFFKPVLWAVSEGITTGTSATTFSPNDDCTRAQVITLLWRAAGSPKVNRSNPFTDVTKADYFYDAVLWAIENGVTTGTSSTTFSPNDDCTRAQIVTLLYRVAGQPSVSGKNPFQDVSSKDYFYNAVLWAVTKGVTTGTSSTTFAPDDTCTRAQNITFIYRDSIN